MHQVLRTLERVRDWVAEDVRVRAALIHGSVVQRDLTPLSDLDLIVIAQPGQRDAIWRDRVPLTTRLLGAPAAVTEVLWQRPYRWQARTKALAMLDLTIDEEYMAMWNGFEGPVEFLIDRADVQGRFDQDMADQVAPAPRDAAGNCDDTWGTLAKIASLTLHHRRQAARTALHDVISESMLVLLDRDPYQLGVAGDNRDAELLERLDSVYPSSSQDAELRRALKAAASWYADLLSQWAANTGLGRPSSAIEAPVMAAIEQLTTAGK